MTSTTITAAGGQGGTASPLPHPQHTFNFISKAAPVHDALVREWSTTRVSWFGKRVPTHLDKFRATSDVLTKHAVQVLSFLHNDEVALTMRVCKGLASQVYFNGCILNRAVRIRTSHLVCDPWNMAGFMAYCRPQWLHGRRYDHLIPSARMFAVFKCIAPAPKQVGMPITVRLCIAGSDAMFQACKNGEIQAPSSLFTTSLAGAFNYFCSPATKTLAFTTDGFDDQTFRHGRTVAFDSTDIEHIDDVDENPLTKWFLGFPLQDLGLDRVTPYLETLTMWQSIRTSHASTFPKTLRSLRSSFSCKGLDHNSGHLVAATVGIWAHSCVDIVGVESKLAKTHVFATLPLAIARQLDHIVQPLPLSEFDLLNMYEFLAFRCNPVLQSLELHCVWDRVGALRTPVRTKDPRVFADKLAEFGGPAALRTKRSVGTAPSLLVVTGGGDEKKHSIVPSKRWPYAFTDTQAWLIPRDIIYCIASTGVQVRSLVLDFSDSFLANFWYEPYPLQSVLRPLSHTPLSTSLRSLTIKGWPCKLQTQDMAEAIVRRFLPSLETFSLVLIDPEYFVDINHNFDCRRYLGAPLTTIDLVRRDVQAALNDMCSEIEALGGIQTAVTAFVDSLGDTKTGGSIRNTHIPGLNDRLAKMGAVETKAPAPAQAPAPASAARSVAALRSGSADKDMHVASVDADAWSKLIRERELKVSARLRADFDASGGKNQPEDTRLIWLYDCCGNEMRVHWPVKDEALQSALLDAPWAKRCSNHRFCGHGGADGTQWIWHLVGCDMTLVGDHKDPAFRQVVDGCTYWMASFRVYPEGCVMISDCIGDAFLQRQSKCTEIRDKCVAWDAGTLRDGFIPGKSNTLCSGSKRPVDFLPSIQPREEFHNKFPVHYKWATLIADTMEKHAWKAIPMMGPADASAETPGSDRIVTFLTNDSMSAIDWPPTRETQRALLRAAFRLKEPEVRYLDGRIVPEFEWPTKIVAGGAYRVAERPPGRGDIEDASHLWPDILEAASSAVTYEAVGRREAAETKDAAAFTLKPQGKPSKNRRKVKVRRRARAQQAAAETAGAATVTEATDARAVAAAAAWIEERQPPLTKGEVFEIKKQVAQLLASPEVAFELTNHGPLVTVAQEPAPEPVVVATAETVSTGAAAESKTAAQPASYRFPCDNCNYLQSVVESKERDAADARTYLRAQQGAVDAIRKAIESSGASSNTDFKDARLETTATEKQLEQSAQALADARADCKTANERVRKLEEELAAAHAQVVDVHLTTGQRIDQATQALGVAITRETETRARESKAKAEADKLRTLVKTHQDENKRLSKEAKRLNTAYEGALKAIDVTEQRLSKVEEICVENKAAKEQIERLIAEERSKSKETEAELKRLAESHAATSRLTGSYLEELETLRGNRLGALTTIELAGLRAHAMKLVSLTTEEEIRRYQETTKLVAQTAAEEMKKNETKAKAVPSGAGAAPATCVICMDAAIDTVLVPCGHMVCCGACAAKIKTCPTCRKVITTRTRVWGA